MQWGKPSSFHHAKKRTRQFLDGVLWNETIWSTGCSGAPVNRCHHCGGSPAGRKKAADVNKGLKKTGCINMLWKAGLLVTTINHSLNVMTCSLSLWLRKYCHPENNSKQFTRADDILPFRSEHIYFFAVLKWIGMCMQLRQYRKSFYNLYPKTSPVRSS
jgi:hypothetical protein